MSELSNKIVRSLLFHRRLVMSQRLMLDLRVLSVNFYEWMARCMAPILNMGTRTALVLPHCSHQRVHIHMQLAGLMRVLR